MIFDADAHVEESAETFAPLTATAAFADTAPRIIEGSKRGYWLIDGTLPPKHNGLGRTNFSAPQALCPEAEFIETTTLP